MTSNLRPCPFCGGEAVMERFRCFYYVRCKNDFCKVHVETDNEYTPEEAISAWNTRYTDASVPADIQQTIDHMRGNLEVFKKIKEVLND